MVCVMVVKTAKTTISVTSLVHIRMSIRSFTHFDKIVIINEKKNSYFPFCKYQYLRISYRV